MRLLQATQLTLCLLVQSALAIPEIHHRCFPLQDGALVRLEPAEGTKLIVMLFHLTDALFTSIPIDVFPLSSWGPLVPLSHHIRGTETPFEPCTQELMNEDICVKLRQFTFYKESECDSEFVNTELSGVQLMKVKDPGVWCVYWSGNGELDIQLHGMQDGVDGRRSRFILWCLAWSVIAFVTALWKWRSVSDPLYTQIRWLMLFIIAFQTTKYYDLKLISQSQPNAYLPYLLRFINLLIFHHLYKLSVLYGGKPHTTKRILFYLLVLAKNFTPILQPLFEVPTWIILYENCKHPNVSLDKPDAATSMYHHRRFPRILLRTVMAILFIQTTTQISYAFWDTAIYDNGYKLLVFEFAVVYNEVLTTMLTDGTIFGKATMLVDETVWPVVITLFAWMW